MTTLNNSFCIIENDEQLSYFRDFRIEKHINKTYPGVILSNKKKHWFVPDDDGLSLRNFISYMRKTSKVELDANRYLDLLYDKITDWRLEEVGFVAANPLEIDGIVLKVPYEDEYNLQIRNICLGVRLEHCVYIGTSIYVHDNTESTSSFTLVGGVKTFSDLLTLIRIIE